jgi:hypothetical protein
MSVTNLIIAGIFIAVTLILLQIRKKQILQTTQSMEKDFSTPLDYMIYFYRFYELIESEDQSNMLILNGKLRQHMQMCTEEMCQCLKIGDYLDELKVMTELMEKEFKKSTRNNRYHGDEYES